MPPFWVTALKLAQVDMYMNSLRERSRRKRLVKDYQLVAQFFAARKERPPKKKLTREQKYDRVTFNFDVDLRNHVFNYRLISREFEDKFKSLCQFMTATEHESLLNSLHKEHDLKRRVKEFTRFRNNGITSFDDCIQFNQLTLARQNYKASVSVFVFSEHSFDRFVCSLLFFFRRTSMTI